MASNDVDDNVDTIPPTTVSFNFYNRVALVTGGANGIGKGCCEAFAKSGARVFCVDNDEKGGNDLVSKLGGEERCRFFPCDVSAGATEIESAVETCVATFGRVDILVNNVGVQLDDGTPAHVLSGEIWRKVLAINLDSYFLFSKYCIEQFLVRQGGGVVINMGSIQGLQSMKGIPAYAASKGAILSMTRQMCMDYSNQGIRVMAVNPGTIRTPFVDKIFRDRTGKDDIHAEWNKAGESYPMGRVGEVSEVANVVLFLASPAASFMTGSYVNVDGGIMAKGGWADTA